MLNLPDNVRQDINRLVPISFVNDISCFVYYDHHPRDSKPIDIIICTKNGEVKEFHQRELVDILILGCAAEPSEIKIMRDSECQLFYIVIAGDSLIILSRKDKMYVHCRVDNVESYDIEDSNCKGEASLKIVRKDDAVPLIFDDKFESLGEKAAVLSCLQAEETASVLTELNRKLIEAQYSVKCNEDTFKEYQSLRQLAAYTMHRKLHPNLEESVFKCGSSDMALKIKTQTPWVKLCNKKIVIVLNIMNEYEEPIENLQILLHVKNRASVVYTTRLFQKQLASPYWKETRNQTIYESEVAVAAVIDLTELKESAISRVEFSGVMVYRRDGKEHMFPFNPMALTAKDIMGEEFDVLCTGSLDEHHTILAVLATTDKTNLLVRHVRNLEEPASDIPSVLASYLEMQRLPNANNVIIHRNSPYHALNGIMCVFSEPQGPLGSCYKMSIHTRTPAQVLSFIHYVHDTVPHRLVISASIHRVTPKTFEFSHYDENLSPWSEVNFKGYALSMINQAVLIKEHMDTCMVSMNESEDPEVLSKLGTEVDFLAAGLPVFLEFRDKMLEEELKGITEMNRSIQEDSAAE